MLRRPKRSKNDVVAHKEEEEEETMLSIINAFGIQATSINNHTMSTKAQKQEFPDIFAEKYIGIAKSLFPATCQHQWQHK